ncbi:M36 family metallopeptidase [Streptomyces griseus]|uniref:M36 family metallopeptidase n=1 Tax=Streptomyces griseus TaxID=1911 RepID=UPI00055DC7D8|nr:M36 family metallopeptidase [Streptomyces griseus]
MTHLIDQRDLEYDRLAESEGAAAFLQETDRVAESVNHTLIAESNKLNRFTGHLTELRVEGAPAALADRVGTDVTDGDYIARAKEYLSSVAGAIGFAAGEPAEFVADPKVTVTSSGMRVVSLQQTLNGIEVWGMAPKVWLREDGTVDRVVGDTASVSADVPTLPRVPAETALAVAAAKAARPATVESPFGADELPALDVPPAFTRLTYQARNDQPVTFEQGPFDEAIPGRLVYFNLGPVVRLAWAFKFSRAHLAVQYQALVEADDRAEGAAAPQILYFQNLTGHISGRVFRRNPAESGFDEVPFPLPLSEYPTLPPPDLSTGFPSAWASQENGHVATVGNNVRAVDGSTEQVFEVRPPAGGDAVFAPQPDTPEQFVTNIFFFCNYMHDFFVTLGFTEEHGNFQTANVSGLGRGADPVMAFAHPGPVEGTANMTTRADGVAAVMNMGLVPRTGRHTANDADVVFHEFTHGVTNRLVGGLHDANGLRENQSRSMGEGWSDFFALTTRNCSQDEERTVIGNWVVDNARGIRQRPYDAQYPGGFGDIGTGRGQRADDLDYTEMHNVGEIWSAALIEMTRRMATALGSKEEGYRITWQAVVDGLKLTPKNPTFLTARDAILRALRDFEGNRLTEDEYRAARAAAWGAFARFGMGFDAFCPNASFTGCRAGTQLPPEGHED